jgi:hypothetical protein
MLLAGRLPKYEPKVVSFSPVPAEYETFPWNSASPQAATQSVKPKATKAQEPSSPPAPAPPSNPMKGKKRSKGAGKRRITMPETCWVSGCQGHMHIGRGGTAAGFCAQHWRKLSRGLRIELLLGRVRRARFEHFLAQAFVALGLPPLLGFETVARLSEKR